MKNSVLKGQLLLKETQGREEEEVPVLRLEGKDALRQEGRKESLKITQSRT